MERQHFGSKFVLFELHSDVSNPFPNRKTSSIDVVLKSFMVESCFTFWLTRKQTEIHARDFFFWLRARLKHRWSSTFCSITEKRNARAGDSVLVKPAFQAKRGAMVTPVREPYSSPWRLPLILAISARALSVHLPGSAVLYRTKPCSASAILLLCSARTSFGRASFQLRSCSVFVFFYLVAPCSVSTRFAFWSSHILRCFIVPFRTSLCSALLRHAFSCFVPSLPIVCSARAPLCSTLLCAYFLCALSAVSLRSSRGRSSNFPCLFGAWSNHTPRPVWLSTGEVGAVSKYLKPAIQAL